MSNQPDNQGINDCPKCKSNNTTYNHEFGYWECQTCGEVWAYSEDDPDWDELHNIAAIKNHEKNS